MRLLFALFIGFVLVSCRTSSKKEDDDERFFADAKNSNDVVVASKVKETPATKLGTPLPPLIPESAGSIEEGAFYVVCAARGNLSSQQALTVKALLAAVHQKDCAAGEKWLRNRHNKALQIDSEELLELQTLSLLRNYTNIQDVYIKAAKGVEPVCPLSSGQTCHFSKADFE